MNDFYSQVYDLVRLIPKGRVITYGAIAKALGSGKSSRLVGIAMNHSHDVSSPVPAHRVINKNGLLTGKHHFTAGLSMQEMLEAEGQIIIDDQITGFKGVLWDPSIEI